MGAGMRRNSSIFQSTLPQGERRGSWLQCPDNPCISIHAPARGATLCSCGKRRVLKYFNPRSRKGSDEMPGLFRIIILLFQSTLPQGERQCRNTGSYRYCNFNPRSRKGSDVLCLYVHYDNCGISIHAPARGATRLFFMLQL